jgi:hypothetical protein
MKYENDTQFVVVHFDFFIIIKQLRHGVISRYISNRCNYTKLKIAHTYLQL